MKKTPNYLKSIVKPCLDPEAIHCLRDIQYNDQDKTAKLDIYRSMKVSEKKAQPTVILYPGGPAPAKIPLKDWAFMSSWAMLLAEQGFHVVAVDHRLIHNSKKEQAGRNARAALDFVLKSHKMYNMNVEKLHVMAFSGSPPILTFLFSQTYAMVTSLVFYYPFLQGGGIVSFLNQLIDCQTFKADLFIACGDKDRVNINAGINKLEKSLDQIKTNVRIERHPTGVHGFDVLNDDGRTHEIIEQTIAFLKRK